MEQESKRRPGRPATGVTPKRNVRIGATWDRAEELAKQLEMSTTAYVEEALRRENTRVERAQARQERSAPTGKVIMNSGAPVYIDEAGKEWIHLDLTPDPVDAVELERELLGTLSRESYTELLGTLTALVEGANLLPGVHPAMSNAPATRDNDLMSGDGGN